MRLPDSVSMEDGAALYMVYSTAYYALVHVAKVGPGDVVLVHSAAGGVGCAAVSICQHFGAKVIATASEAKRNFVRSQGVEHVFDSRSTSWYDEVMRVTNSKGVTIVLNSLAGIHQKLGIEALAPSGRCVCMLQIDAIYPLVRRY